MISETEIELPVVVEKERKRSLRSLKLKFLEKSIEKLDEKNEESSSLKSKIEKLETEFSDIRKTMNEMFEYIKNNK